MFPKGLFMEERYPALLTCVALWLPGVSPPVFLHVIRQPEAFITYVTFKWLFSRVDAHVRLQISRLNEGFSALFALVRALPRVVPVVEPELVGGQEGLTAHRTLVWPLAGVDELVPLQGRLLHELLPAAVAGIPDADVDLFDVVRQLQLGAVSHVALCAGPGSLLGVGSHVHRKLRGRAVTLPALPAQEGFLPGVFPLMNRQTVGGPELLRAHVTDVRELSFVDSLVDGEVGQLHEGFVALCTRIRSGEVVLLLVVLPQASQ